MNQKEIENLAEEHWKYVKLVLETHKIPEEEVKRIGVHYRESFKHGFGHGYEFASNPLKKLWDNPEDEKWDDILKGAK